MTSSDHYDHAQRTFALPVFLGFSSDAAFAGAVSTGASDKSRAAIVVDGAPTRGANDARAARVCRRYGHPRGLLAVGLTIAHARLDRGRLGQKRDGAGLSRGPTRSNQSSVRDGYSALARTTPTAFSPPIESDFRFETPHRLPVVTLLRRQTLLLKDATNDMRQNMKTLLLRGPGRSGSVTRAEATYPEYAQTCNQFIRGPPTLKVQRK
ncbi:hypothetical protein T492DRAFT_839879 [Pavlovales sp. CCMP2436]|nr:hypothetical protein T492DRAFT_839879 [Pavlovales sp. CCMP2436]